MFPSVSTWKPGRPRWAPVNWRPTWIERALKLQVRLGNGTASAQGTTPGDDPGGGFGLSYQFEPCSEASHGETRRGDR